MQQIEIGQPVKEIYSDEFIAFIVRKVFRQTTQRIRDSFLLPPSSTDLLELANESELLVPDKSYKFIWLKNLRKCGIWML